MKPSILWFRLDLRLGDNPALLAACKRGTVIPLYIWAPEEEGAWAPGGASKWWLHQSLDSLSEDLRARGSRLIIQKGSALTVLQDIVKETDAAAVLWNRRYEPAIVTRDQKIIEALRADGRAVESFNSALLHEPWDIKNKSGKPFQVFTPFWNHCLSLDEPDPPLRSPKKLLPPAKWPRSLTLKELALEPKINWAAGIAAAWRPGETGARASLRRFLTRTFQDYSQTRNRPDTLGTSRLSPHLHFGEISPRQIWHAIRKHAKAKKIPVVKWQRSQFLAEIGWREFAHHLLYHFPHTPSEPLRPEFKDFPRHEDEQLLRAWQKGRTGYPIVDAGMRELWATGWMHNRVRMIVASFLVKDLRIRWQSGAKWFWDTLVDADLANNTLGWQWASGCGADAAPFFRIFNPVLQGEKFDPNGIYVRRWCPELAGIPARWIHKPDRAPAEVLRKAGVTIGVDYPECVVSHAAARDAALRAYDRIKRRAGESNFDSGQAGKRSTFPEDSPADKVR